MQEGGNRGREKKKKKENVVSKNLHLPHPDQHVSLSGVRAEMRLVKLPCVSILGCLAFVWGRKRWRGHSLAQGERTAKQSLYWKCGRNALEQQCRRVYFGQSNHSKNMQIFRTKKKLFKMTSSHRVLFIEACEGNNRWDILGKPDGNNIVSVPFMLKMVPLDKFFCPYSEVQREVFPK